MESPRISMRWALCTRRSRMPSASVGSPICSCHRATGNCEVRIVVAATEAVPSPVAWLSQTPTLRIGTCSLKYLREISWVSAFGCFYQAQPGLLVCLKESDTKFLLARPVHAESFVKVVLVASVLSLDLIKRRIQVPRFHAEQILRYRRLAARRNEV